jgi:NADH dehydrogenase (ubiquinone) Fe-S protein 1
MIKVVVDGIEVFVERGSTVLQACEAVGVEVPRFCYHERLSIAGNCRMCLVEIFKTPKPVASCAMPTMEGMQIFTDTPLVKKAREAVLEFLLLNHPLDCPICDQGGECDLQDQAMAFGSDRSRFFETKRGVENKNCGPLIKTIMTRCIHCTRCVRFATEIAGVEDLGTTGRGRETEIGTYIEKTFKSELSGNVIDLCPVGALTSKPYAFLSRPWELRSTESIDVSDSIGSNIRIDSRGTEILRILPRFNEEINEEWLSDKARFSYDGLKLQRLNTPYVKKGGRLEACGWEEALEAASSKLKSCDGTQITGVLGESSDSYTTLAARDFFTKLGSPNLIQQKGFSGLNSGVRSGYSLNTPIADIEKSDVCLIVGVDTRYEASMLNVRLRKRFLEGNFTVATIGAPSDLTFETKHLGTSLSTLAQVAEGKHPFCAALAQAEKPMVVFGGGLLESADSELAVNFLTYLNKGVPGLSTDNWQGLNILPSGANQVGQMDLGVNTHSSIEPSVLFLFGADDYEVDTSGNSFVIYLGHHGDVNASKADIILPGAAFTEKSAPYVNAEGRTQETRRVFLAPDLAREDWKIIRALSEIMGGTFQLPYDNVDTLKERLYQVAPSFMSNDEFVSCTFNAFDSKIDSPVSVSRDPLTKKVADFYKTDSISRASRVMTKCSSAYRNSSNFI